MWVLVDGDRTQVVTTLGEREGVFVEVSDGCAWWAVKQERNGKGSLVTRKIELTDELRRIVENAEFDREWPEGAQRPPVRARSSADKPAHGWFGSTPYPGNDGSWERFREALVFGPPALAASRERVAADPTDPQAISKDAALALLDCAVMAERAATYMEERREDETTTVFSLGDLGEHMDAVKRADAQVRSITKDALITLLHGAIIADRAADHIEEGRTEDAKRWKADFERVSALHREAQKEMDSLRTAIADHETKLAQASGRNRIHSMDREPPEDGVYVVWQKWPAETPLAGVAPALRTFAGGLWSARSGADAGWSFVPKGVL